MPIRRTGSIHLFSGEHPGPTVDQYESSPPMPKKGIPVEVIDADLLSPIGKGRLVETYIKHDYLMGTVEWDDAVDKLAGDGQPEAHCKFNRDGSIRNVVVEVSPDCECGGSGKCECDKPAKSYEATDTPIKFTADGTHRKIVPFETKDASGESTTFVVTTDNVDRDGEVLDPRGMVVGPYLLNPVLCWCHDAKQLPLGQCKAIELQPGGQSWDARFEWIPADIHPFAGQVKAAVDARFVRAVSVGLKPIEYGPPTRDEIVANPHWKGAVRIHRRWELLEISVVVVPANRDALRKAAAMGADVPDFLTRDMAESSGVSGGYTVPAIEERDESDMFPKCKAGDHVKWSYQAKGKKCMGFGKVKSCHMKGEDMPEADNMEPENDDDLVDKAGMPKPKGRKCSTDMALVKCFMAAAAGKKAWKPTGKHELHPIEKMTVLKDGLPEASEDAGEGQDERSHVPPVIKSMIGGPFASPDSIFMFGPADPFEDWEEQAVMAALESLHWRKLNAIASILGSDMLDGKQKVELVGKVCEAHKEHTLKIISGILEAIKDEAPAKAARSLVLVANARVKAIEAPYRTSNDQAEPADSFAEWFAASVSGVTELRDALARRAEVRTKAGRVLSEASFAQINAAIEAMQSATDALVTLRDRAKPADPEAEAKAAKAASDELRIAALKRRAELRRVLPTNK